MTFTWQDISTWLEIIGIIAFAYFLGFAGGFTKGAEDQWKRIEEFKKNDKS